MSVHQTVEEIVFTRWTRRQGRKRVSRKFHWNSSWMKWRKIEVERKKSFKALSRHVNENGKSNKMMELCDSVSAGFSRKNKLQLASRTRMMGKWKVNEIHFSNPDSILIDFSFARICIWEHSLTRWKREGEGEQRDRCRWTELLTAGNQNKLEFSVVTFKSICTCTLVN